MMRLCFQAACLTSCEAAWMAASDNASVSAETRAALEVSARRSLQLHCLFAALRQFVAVRHGCFIFAPHLPSHVILFLHSWSV
jgi:hypothetical protein